MAEPSTNPSVSIEAGSLDRLAYDKIEKIIRSIPESSLSPLTLDVPSAVSLVLGNLPEILQYRDAAARLPDFDISAFDNLELYTRAVAHSQTRYLAATEPRAPIEDFARRAVQIREDLYTDATTLVKRKKLDGALLDNIRGAVGYQNILSDLALLAEVLRTHWPSIQGRTALELSELDEAEQVFETLRKLLALRAEAPQDAADAVIMRQKACVLLVKSYEQVRRAIMFIRHEAGDFDEIAPSLFAGRGGSRRKPEAPPPPESPSAPKAPAVTAQAEEKESNAPLGLDRVPTGMPGSAHFSDS